MTVSTGSCGRPRSWIAVSCSSCGTAPPSSDVRIDGVDFQNLFVSDNPQLPSYNPCSVFLSGLQFHTLCCSWVQALLLCYVPEFQQAPWYRQSRYLHSQRRARPVHSQLLASKCRAQRTTRWIRAFLNFCSQFFSLNHIRRMSLLIPTSSVL